MARKGVGERPLVMLGIDVSSNSLSAALWLNAASSPVWEKEVPNTPAGVLQLLRLTPLEAPWVIEPTGRYSLNVVKQAKAAGRSVLLAPPRQAKAFLRSIQSRAKTDPLDGRGLALFGLSRPLSVYPIKSETVDHLDQLLSARKGLSRSLAQLRLQADALPLARQSLLPAIEHLSGEIKLIDKQIDEKVKASPEFASAAKLKQITGIGRVTAAALASRLSAKQFTHPDQLVAYVGLDVGIRQSGKRHGETGLTKQGDAELRRLLYVCAQATLRTKDDNPFKAQYARERAKGLPTTGALCAVARKLAKVCWSIHKHNTDYDPQRVSKSPERKDQTTTESATGLDNKP
jgi:transposase